MMKSITIKEWERKEERVRKNKRRETEKNRERSRERERNQNVIFSLMHMKADLFAAFHM